MSITLSSREFNQDAGRAKKAAEAGPVIITDRGRPSHVLLSFEDYQRLIGAHTNFWELLGSPAGVEAVELKPPRSRELAQPAEFD